MPGSNSSPQPLFSPGEWAELVAGLGLPTRQAEIIWLLLAGHSDQQIADRLKLKLPTVRTHLQRTYASLDVRDRTTLVVKVFRRFRAGQR